MSEAFRGSGVNPSPAEQSDSIEAEYDMHPRDAVDIVRQLDLRAHYHPEVFGGYQISARYLEDALDSIVENQLEGSYEELSLELKPVIPFPTEIPLNSMSDEEYVSHVRAQDSLRVYGSMPPGSALLTFLTYRLVNGWEVSQDPNKGGYHTENVVTRGIYKEQAVVFIETSGTDWLGDFTSWEIATDIPDRLLPQNR